MALLDKIKKMFQKKAPAKEPLIYRVVSLLEIEKKYEADDFVGAAKDLKMLLDFYGKRKNKKHKFKGREFIDFILSSKHKDLKNAGFMHWQNVAQIIQSNHAKVYPYYKKKLRDALDFFSKEIHDLHVITMRI